MLDDNIAAMATLAVSPVVLNGAPDALIGTPEGRSSAIPMMQLDLTDDVLEELLQCTKTGKAPHIIFGRTPVCKLPPGPLPPAGAFRCCCSHPLLTC